MTLESLSARFSKTTQELLDFNVQATKALTDNMNSMIETVHSSLAAATHRNITALEWAVKADREASQAKRDELAKALRTLTDDVRSFDGTAHSSVSAAAHKRARA